MRENLVQLLKFSKKKIKVSKEIFFCAVNLGQTQEIMLLCCMNADDLGLGPKYENFFIHFLAKNRALKSCNKSNFSHRRECIDYTIASNFSPLSYSSSLLMSTIFHLFSLDSSRYRGRE